MHLSENILKFYVFKFFNLVEHIEFTKVSSKFRRATEKKNTFKAFVKLLFQKKRYTNLNFIFSKHFYNAFFSPLKLLTPKKLSKIINNFILYICLVEKINKLIIDRELIETSTELMFHIFNNPLIRIENCHIEIKNIDEKENFIIFMSSLPLMSNLECLTLRYFNDNISFFMEEYNFSFNVSKLKIKNFNGNITYDKISLNKLFCNHLLRYLDLRNAFNTRTVHFFEFLEKNTSITNLNLSYNNFVFLNENGKVIECLSNNSYLTTINLHSCLLSKISLEKMPNLIQNTYITDLDIGSINLKPVIKQIFQNLKCNFVLKCLSLSSCSLSDEYLNDIEDCLDNHKTLVKINLENNLFTNLGTLFHSFKILNNKIEYLSIGKSQNTAPISEFSLSIEEKEFSNILVKNLDISSFHILNFNFRKMINGLINVQYLNLNRTSINKEGIDILVESLNKKKTFLQVLCLENNKLTTELIAPILFSLKNNSSLFEIFLGWNELNEAVINNINEMLMSNKTLKIIELSCNPELEVFQLKSLSEYIKKRIR
jgi:hypothetical protein